MAFPPIPLNVGDLIQGRFVCSSQKQFAFNIRHWRVEGMTAAGTQHLQALVDAFDILVAPRYKNIISPEARYEGSGMRRVAGGVGPPSVELISLVNQGDGTSVGDILPRQASGIATLRSAFPGRSKRGRIYLPFPAEDDNSADGTPTTAYLVRMRLLLDVLATSFTVVLAGGIGNVDLVPIIYQRGTGAQTNIVAYLDRDRWATQRRRSDFGALNASPWA